MKTVMICLATVAAVLLATTSVSALSLRSETFDVDPGWTGINNIDGGTGLDMQWQNTNNAGGTAGEAGGFITRASPAATPSYYADTTVGPLTLSDVLEMNWTGAPALYSTTGFSSELYIGFFDTSKHLAGIPPITATWIGLRVEGNRFVPGAGGGGENNFGAPNLEENTMVGQHEIRFRYDGAGTLTVDVNGNLSTYVLSAGIMGSGATFDGFGIAPVADGEWHVRDGTQNLDNVNYTIIPEPATMGLLVAGGLLMLRRRR